MKKFEHGFAVYLNETLDISVKPEEWGKEGFLPFFLRDMYFFFKVSILGVPCLVIVPREEEERPPATVRKHIEQVRKQWSHQIIFSCSRISSFNRKRLIEQKIPFVVPGNQMFLPPLGIDLRERFKAKKTAKVTWTPSTQAAFVYALVHYYGQDWTPKEMAERLNYTPMSMTRAFNEMEASNIGRIAMQGKQRVLRLEEDRELLWKKAQAFLKSPVRKRLWVKIATDNHHWVRAGLSALAQYSNLADPSNQVLAIDSKRWKEFQKNNKVMELPFPEPGAFQLEIWRYSPDFCAQNGLVGHFSLYLSLKDTDDERVELALAEMMEGIRW